MWYIKFLTGPLAGKSLPLRTGRNTVGRAPHCDVVIPSNNISKEHCSIEVYNDKIIITDLKSRNGTFINGVQIKSHKLNPRERLGLFDILCEITQRAPKAKRESIRQQYAQPNESYHGNLAYQQDFQTPMSASEESPAPQAIATTNNTFLSYMQRYVDEVVLPGVYKLTEWFEYRTVLGLFICTFIVFVTLLSTIPLMRILKSSIEKEAQNRAQTIARSLARDNRAAVMQGQLSLVTIESAYNEAGADAYIIASPNGDILAPPQMAGQYLTKIDFIHEARKTSQAAVKQINDDTIVAVEPIRFYNAQIGGDTVPAHAVVIYNMGALAIDDGRTLSLFVQILFIAILLGGLLYFFMYKIIQLPILQLNKQIDTALREGQAQISTTIQWDDIQQLATNINSAVNRTGGAGFGSENIQQYEADRSHEMQNVCQLIGFAAIAVKANDRVIAAANEPFISQIGQNGQWTNISVDAILDQALKLNVQNLVERVSQDTYQLVQDQLEISGVNYDISAQGIMGAKELSYILIVFIPRSGAS